MWQISVKCVPQLLTDEKSSRNFWSLKTWLGVPTLLTGLIWQFVTTSGFWMKSQLQEHIFLYVPDTQGQLQTILHAIPKSQFQQYSVQPLCKACSTFYVVRATLDKFGLHVGNMKFSTKNKEVYMLLCV